MTQDQARRVIYDLMDAATDSALVQVQDGGKRVDVVMSKKNPKRLMTLAESEERYDAAIQHAWKLMVGEDLAEEDPVSFIMEIGE